ncbi:unnamed protein product [Paramecium pentaurelia]|uniref:Uncharacterized protein n=1 Tax=Paramecium pentaurelia TaxID=43138 RepID=A0A8S1U1G7_9CILI|nr:unnamed protein product [Paramecium pentaurelia]
MNQSLFSFNLKALLPMENYQLILNEQTRMNKYIHSQNTIQIKELDLEQITRRKSCHCGQCGQQSQFQFKTMNIPLKVRQIPKEQEQIIPELIVTKPESRLSTFYKKSSFKNLQIIETKDQTNNTQLSLNIHGLKRAYNRQNTLLKLITDGQERSKRRDSSGLFSSSDLQSLNSLKSLNITTSPTQSFLQNQKNSIQPKSPLSLFSPKRKHQQTHNKLQSTNTRNYNPYVINSNKQLLIKPLKLQNSLSTLGSSFPKLNKKKQ